MLSDEELAELERAAWDGNIPLSWAKVLDLIADVRAIRAELARVRGIKKQQSRGAVDRMTPRRQPIEVAAALCLCGDPLSIEGAKWIRDLNDQLAMSRECRDNAKDAAKESLQREMAQLRADNARLQTELAELKQGATR